MNCKPGDLAQVVSINGLEGEQLAFGRMLLGRVVRVVRLNEEGLWEIEDCIEISGVCWSEKGHFWVTTSGEVEAIADWMLRPLPRLTTEDRMRDEVTP